MPSVITCDLAIVGGGLAGGLIARAVAVKRPDVSIRLIEGGETLGGDHVWSFFGADVAPGDRWIVERFVAHAWRGHRVRFPGLDRALEQPYYSVTSDRFDARLRADLPAEAVLTGRGALEIGPTAVTLADGDRIEAKGVIDARGAGALDALDIGWQKFVGREVKLAAPHGLDRPVVMDARVEQLDGYRFMYLLPFGKRRLFLEDTYYSDTPAIDTPVLEARIAAYLDALGWRAARSGRGEQGALPVALGGDFEDYWRASGCGIAKAGARAGLFHPLTSYSLPDAVRLAALIARASDLSGAALHELSHAHAAAAWRARGFYRLLARMLFRAAEPAERWRVLARFYRLDPALISRFYASRSTLLDKARLLAGKPPVPIGRAVKAARQPRRPT